jgi:hypothetical protein
MPDEVLTRYGGMDRGVKPSDLRKLVTSAVDNVAFVVDAQSVPILQNIPGNLVITLDRQRIQRILVNLFGCHARRRDHSNLGNS